MKDTQRVGALWALVLVAFAVFNAVYWPLHQRQSDLDPANFMRYANKLREGKQLASAIDTLKKGIAAHHPPVAAPYERLRDYLREFNDDKGAAALAPMITFYNALHSNVTSRDEALRVALDEAKPQVPLPALSADAARGLGVLGFETAFVLGAPVLGRDMNLAQQFTLLTLADGMINTTGQIGGTGVSLPGDLLVQSGGGARTRRIAHILWRGRDFGGSQRGFHVALIDPVSGQILQTGVFDVWATEEEADLMARLLSDAPNGIVAAMTVLDDASLNINDGLDAQLRAYGLMPTAMIQRRARYMGLRYSFAAIGVKGAAPGTAMQAWSPADYEGKPGHPVACVVITPPKGGRP